MRETVIQFLTIWIENGRLTGDRVRQTESSKEKCDSKNIESDVRIKDYINSKTKMVEYAERRSTEARRKSKFQV